MSDMEIALGSALLGSLVGALIAYRLGLQHARRQEFNAIVREVRSLLLRARESHSLLWYPDAILLDRLNAKMGWLQRRRCRAGWSRLHEEQQKQRRQDQLGQAYCDDRIPVVTAIDHLLTLLRER